MDDAALQALLQWLVAAALVGASAVVAAWALLPRTLQSRLRLWLGWPAAAAAAAAGCGGGCSGCRSAAPPATPQQASPGVQVVQFVRRRSGD